MTREIRIPGNDADRNPGFHIRPFHQPLERRRALFRAMHKATPGLHTVQVRPTGTEFILMPAGGITGPGAWATELRRRINHRRNRMQGQR